MTNPITNSKFDDLLRRNRGRLAAISRAYSPADADDLLQEILLQIWKGLSGFRDQANIDTWCYRVALNTSLTWKRTHGRRRNNLPEVPFEDTQLPVRDDGQDAVKLLQRFLQSIPDTDRALVLLYLDDLSGREIANIMGMSESAVRVRIHRIKNRLANWEACAL